MMTQIGDKRVHFPKRGLVRQKERGIALLLTIFGLLLLTAVAVAMMFSSDSETTIAVNYRDKQKASYAAFAGVQEARERLQPTSGDLFSLLTAVPSASNGQVLYIVNPNTSQGETMAKIAPWSPTVGGKTNPYFDTELCQENMLSLTGTAGVVCPTSSASVPSGSGWYQTYDESSSTNTTSWKLSSPLDYKWVRVTLKEDTNTPAYINPSSTTGGQVCWDGIYQDPKPSNYNTSCQNNNGNQVIGVNLTAAGSGYTSAPTVAITGGGGSGASVTATIAPAASDAISSIINLVGGSGFTSPPTVTLTGGTGSGATFQAVVSSQGVTGVTINSAGTNYCYSSNPTGVNFSTNPSTDTLANATATISMNSTAGCIVTASSSTHCPSLTIGNTYAITSIAGAGSGSGFGGTVTIGTGHKVTINVSTVGSGYSNTGAATIVASGCSITSSTVTTGSQLSSIGITSGGNYMIQPTVALSGGAFVGNKTPTLTALPNPWPAAASSITAINITNGGGSYTPAVCLPLTITGGGGSGASASACATGSYILSGFTNLVGGSGYTTPPTVTISGGGGSGATATASIGSGGVNTSMGRVYLITALAVTKAGTKSMVQMEAGVRPPFNLNLGGAVTLADPEPSADCQPFATRTSSSTCIFPNSANLTVSGVDANSCSGAQSPAKPAVGTYDNQSQTSVINAINPGRDSNYIGVDGTSTNPSVEQVYAALGGADLTPQGLNNYVQDISTTPGTTNITGPATSLPATTSTSATVVDGDLSLSGHPSGSGILIVTGTLTLSGDFTWNGLVLVIGKGIMKNNGGGNMTINGAVYVAQTLDPTASPAGDVLSTSNQNGWLSSMTQGVPTFQWNGGGTNQIQYDHCKADALLKNYQNKASSLPLQILSSRTLQF